MSPYLPWTDERLDRAKTLWMEGVSAGEIAKTLGGTSRNAVIAKLHRAGLIGSSSRAAPSHPNLGAARRLKPLPVVTKTVKPAPALTSRPPVMAPDVAPPAPALRLAAGGCRWPIGHPGQPDFHFCEAAPVAGRPYCGDHCRRAGMSAAPKPVQHFGRVAQPFEFGRERRAV